MGHFIINITPIGENKSYREFNIPVKNAKGEYVQYSYSVHKPDIRSIEKRYVSDYGISATHAVVLNRKALARLQNFLRRQNKSLAFLPTPYQSGEPAETVKIPPDSVLIAGDLVRQTEHAYLFAFFFNVPGAPEKGVTRGTFFIPKSKSVIVNNRGFEYGKNGASVIAVNKYFFYDKVRNFGTTQGLFAIMIDELK